MRWRRLYCRLTAHEWHMPHPYRILVCARCDTVRDFGEWDDSPRFSGKAQPSQVALWWQHWWNKLTEE